MPLPPEQRFAEQTVVPSTHYTTPAVQPASFNVTESGTLLTGSGRTISRGEFVTMLVDKLYSPTEMNNCFWDISPTWPPHYSLLFTDVPVDQPDSSAICIAMRDGFIKGYKDGSFHPNEPITFVEASKILSRAFVLAPYAETDKTGPWFGAYALALSNRNAIPSSIKSFDQKMKAGEADDMLNRIAFGITWEPATSFDDLMKPWIAANTPKPVVQRATTVKQVQARTPLEGASSSVGSSAADASAMSAGSSSSKAPWYKIF